MDLILKEHHGFGDGAIGQVSTEYSVPGSSVILTIIHSTTPQSYFVGFPTKTNIPDALGIFKYLAGIEPPESKTPLEVCVYEEMYMRFTTGIEPHESGTPLEVSLHEERDVYRKGITHYPLDVDPAVIEKKLFESSGGHVGLILPNKSYALNVAGREPTGFSLSSREDKLPAYLNDVLQMVGVAVNRTTLDVALRQLETKMAYFKQLDAIIN